MKGTISKLLDSLILFEVKRGGPSSFGEEENGNKKGRMRWL